MFDLFYLIELRNEQQTEYYKQRNSFFTPKKKASKPTRTWHNNNRIR